MQRKQKMLNLRGVIEEGLYYCKHEFNIDPKELSKLEADVDEELKISDDLMFRTLHLRQKYISDECKKSNN